MKMRNLQVTVHHLAASVEQLQGYIVVFQARGQGQFHICTETYCKKVEEEEKSLSLHTRESVLCIQPIDPQMESSDRCQKRPGYKGTTTFELWPSDNTHTTLPRIVFLSSNCTCDTIKCHIFNCNVCHSKMVTKNNGTFTQYSATRHQFVLSKHPSAAPGRLTFFSFRVK